MVKQIRICSLLLACPCCIHICIDFVHDNLPGWKFDEYIEYTNEHEAIGEQMLTAMETSESADAKSKMSGLVLMEGDHQGYELYEKKAALNANQYMTEYTKAPCTMRAQPYLVPCGSGQRTIFLCERTPAFKAKYPTIKIYHGSRDEVLVNSTQRGNNVALCDAHRSMALMGLSKQRDSCQTPAAKTAAMTPKRLIPSDAHTVSHEELMKRITAMSENTVKKKVKRKDGSLADDFEDGSQFDEGEDTKMEESCKLLALTDDSGDSSAIRQEDAPPKIRAKLMIHKAASFEISKPQTNPHPVGSFEYWMWELSIEVAFDCGNVGHAISQSKIAAPKLPEDQRNKLLIRVGLVEKSKIMGYKVVGALSDAELTFTWNVMRSARAKLTTKLKASLWERYVNNCKKQMAATASYVDKKVILTELQHKAAMWKKEDSVVDDVSVTKPDLNSLGFTDAQTSKAFIDTVYSTMVNALLDLDEAGKDDVALFLGVAKIEFDMPDDCEMDDECAGTLLDAKQTNSILQCLLYDGVTIETNVSVYDHIKAFDEAVLHPGGVSSPMNVTAAKIHSCPWWSSRLSIVAKNLGGLKVNTPAIKKRCIDVDGIERTPSSKNAILMGEICAEIVYWDAAVPTMNLTGNLKDTMAKKAKDQASVLTSKKTEKNYHEFDPATKCNILHDMKTMFAKLVKAIPNNHELKVSQQALHDEVALLDMASKHGLLNDVANPLVKWNEERTLRLKDALLGCAGEALPDDSIEAIDKCWINLFTDVCDTGADTFLIDGAGWPYQGLDLLASAMTGHEKEKRLKISEWLHAAWRMKTTVRELSTSKLAPESTSTDAEKLNAVKEMQRAAQRVAHLSIAANKIDKAKHFDLSAKVKLEEELAIEAVTLHATQGRAKVENLLHGKVTQLIHAMQNEAFISFEKLVAESKDLNQLLTFFEANYAGTDTDEWLAICTDVDGLMKAVITKTNEFNLAPAKEVLGFAELALTKGRAAASVHQIMTNIGTSPIVTKADKVALRGKMKIVQDNIKSFAIKPNDLGNAVIIKAYKDALAMNFDIN